MVDRILHVRKFSCLCVVLLFATFLVGVGVTTTATALEVETQSDEYSTQQGSEDWAFTQDAAGTYFVREGADNWRIITLTRDGNWFGIASVQNSIPDAPGMGFTDQQGTWKFAGHKKIIAKVLDFNFDANDGSHIGNSVAIYKLEFSQNFRKLSGEYSGKEFPKDQNPLDPEDPNDFIPFEGAVEGMRVTVYN